MLKNILLFLTLIVAATASAQIDRKISNSRQTVKFVPGSAVLANNPSTGMAWQSVGSPFISTPAVSGDGYVDGVSTTSEANHNKSASKSQGNDNAADTPAKVNENIADSIYADSYAYPMFATFGGFGSLHQGMNASIGLSVMAGFGKNAPKGAGFSQKINATYLTPIGKKAWLAAGGFVNHLNWDGMNVTNGGLYAELGYRFNDHWAAYVYGQKSLVNNGSNGYYGYNGLYGYPGLWGNPYYYDYGYGYMPGYNPFGDKLGAAVQWTPNSKFSFQLSVEKNWYPHSNNVYNRRYDYQK